MSEQFLIEKRGYYYRPNAQGYTALKEEAGRYSFEDAAEYSGPNGPDGSQDGIVIWCEADAPEYSRSCDAITKERHIKAKLVEALEALLAAHNEAFPNEAALNHAVDNATDAAIAVLKRARGEA